VKRDLAQNMFRASVLIAGLIIVGCQNPTFQPGLLAQTQQDCTSGDRKACAMLGVLSAIAVRVEASELNPPNWPQIENDIEAIIQGIDRASSSRHAQTNDP
jgi:hypothetical protein